MEHRLIHFVLSGLAFNKNRNKCNVQSEAHEGRRWVVGDSKGKVWPTRKLKQCGRWRPRRGPCGPAARAGGTASDVGGRLGAAAGAACAAGPGHEGSQDLLVARLAVPEQHVPLVVVVVGQVRRRGGRRVLVQVQQVVARCVVELGQRMVLGRQAAVRAQPVDAVAVAPAHARPARQQGDLLVGERREGARAATKKRGTLASSCIGQAPEQGTTKE